MGEIEKRKSTSGAVAKVSKLAELASNVEHAVEIKRQEIRIDMRISEIVAEAEIAQDELERG